MTSVSVVDSDRMLLDGLTEWFSRRPDLSLVHACGSVDELLDAEPFRADVVLLGLVPTDPVSGVRRLVAYGRRVLVTSSAWYADQLMAAMCAGASGYLTKDHDLATLAHAIHGVAGGSASYEHSASYEPVGPEVPLAPRERELLLAYVSGLTMTAAARRIGVRPSTARTYLERIKKKYAGAGRPAYTKLELAARVREDGL